MDKWQWVWDDLIDCLWTVLGLHKWHNINYNLMIRYCCRKTKDFYITYRIAHNHLCWTRFGGKKDF